MYRPGHNGQARPVAMVTSSVERVPQHELDGFVCLKSYKSNVTTIRALKTGLHLE